MSHITLLLGELSIFIVIGLASIIGAIIGSFCNVVIRRLPSMVTQPANISFNLAYPSSHCPLCKANIPWYFNLPILGYCLLRGKCHKCKQPIAAHYLWVELLGGLLLPIIMLRFITLPWAMLAVTLAVFILLCLAFIDYKHYILPDPLVWTLLWLGLLITTIEPIYATTEDALWGIVVGYLSLYVLNIGYLLVRKQTGIGQGDMKLSAALGAWLGWYSLPFLLGSAALLGIIYSLCKFYIEKQFDFKVRLPYGTFLSIVAISVMISPYQFWINLPIFPTL